MPRIILPGSPVPDTGYQVPGTPPKVAVITGFLGAGKTTLAEHLQERHGSGIVRAVTYTTRPPREGERHGVHYHFVDEPAFLAMRESGRFFETNTLPTGYHYGTPHFLEVGADPEKVILYVIDPNGAIYFKDNHPETEVFFLYVSPEEQRRRLLHGRESDPTVEARLTHYANELELLKRHEQRFHVLRNEDADDMKKAAEHFRRTLQLG